MSRQTGMQELDGNRAVEPSVPAITHFGHRAETKDASQLVTATEGLGTRHACGLPGPFAPKPSPNV
jgi:hypothetical protein